ncbi:uncharacterized protein LOC116339701 [Contarinia nasturtii]|uniref:uncharacterized protein LOC116339701 n=1 Tax=Contarinia nasturtii TaxID=265458 RepID=UPI0012D4C18C|nr:uncharacterized protein LOC116339701 [Contarinia nasturtii]
MKYYFIFVVACCLIPSILNAPTPGKGKGSKAADKGKHLVSKAVKTATQIAENPLVEAGADLAVDPVTLTAAKATVKGVKKFHETGNLAEAGQAAIESGIASSSGVADGFINGAGLVKDIHDGKDVKASVLHRGKQTVKNLPGGQALTLGIDAGKDLLDGKSAQQVITESGKEALKQNVPGVDLAKKVKILSPNTSLEKKRKDAKLQRTCSSFHKHFTSCLAPETESDPED